MRDDEDDDRPQPELDDFVHDGAWDLSEDSRELLVASLKSDDREARLEALDMLAHSLDDGLAALALEVARGDADEEERTAAVEALGPGLAATAAAEAGAGPAPPLAEAGAASVRQGLRQLYFDSAIPKRVRRSALETAVLLPDAWQEGAVRASWASGDPEWRTTAVRCMARLEGFAGELVEALRDREPQVRLEAARAVGDAETREAAPRLLALARAADEEARVRMAAMESLGLLGDREAIAPLRELASAADPELAFAARSALARIAGGDEGESDDDPFP